MNGAILSDLRIVVMGHPHTDPEREREQRIERQQLAEILVAARSLIADEAHFCKGTWAIDKDGCRWDAESISRMPSFAARQFCAEGAIYWAAFWTGRLDWERLADRACDILAGLVGTKLYVYSDFPSTTHRMIQALFTEGVERVLGAGR